MTPWRKALAAVAVFALIPLMACSAGVAAPGEGRTQSGSSSEIIGVASVTDGDTIEIHGAAIRLWGFDAPERGSVCGSINVYQRASLALSDYIRAQTVHCRSNGTDTHGRTVAICTVGGVDLGEHMVSEGWARDWPRFSHGAYSDEEASARNAHRGIWALDCPASLWGNRNYSPR